MLRKAGTGVGGMYITLVSVAALLVMFGALIIVPAIMHVQQVVITAAQNGARVASLTENTDQVQQAVGETLQASQLPTTYNGQTLFTVSATNVQNGPSAPVATVTVSYHAPILFPNIMAGLGHPNSLPLSIPLKITESYVNETYWSGAGGGN